MRQLLLVCALIDYMSKANCIFKNAKVCLDLQNR